MKLKKINIILLIIALCIVIYVFKRELNNRKTVIKDPCMSYGTITNYSWNDGGGVNLTYSYLVDHKIYKRYIIAKHNYFPNCAFSKDCIGRKFILLYSKDTPSKSLINLKEEVFGEIDLDTLKLPDNFDNYE